MMAHNFKVGDRVRNGDAKATVVELASDDFLIVVYDDNRRDEDPYDGEPQIRLAVYFEHIEDGPL